MIRKDERKKKSLPLAFARGPVSALPRTPDTAVPLPSSLPPEHGKRPPSPAQTNLDSQAQKPLPWNPHTPTSNHVTPFLSWPSPAQRTPI